MNHYEWLNLNFGNFISALNIKNPDDYIGMIVAEGDKCYQYEDEWAEMNIPFEHGAALYLISKIHPWNTECRNTTNGWVPVEEWVITNYCKFKNLLPESIEQINSSTTK